MLQLPHWLRYGQSVHYIDAVQYMLFALSCHVLPGCFIFRQAGRGEAFAWHTWYTRQIAFGAFYLLSTEFHEAADFSVPRSILAQF